MIIDNMVISRNTTQSELSKLDGSFFDLKVPINAKNVNGNTVQVESVINNTNFQADYPVNVVGITAHMANNGNSVLLAVAAADGAIVMPAGADMQYTQYIDFSITNDNAADVTVEINPIGTVSNDTFNSAVNSLSSASNSNAASLSNEFSNYATNSELASYATNNQLTSLSSNNSASINALSNQFSNYVPTSTLASYATTSQLNSAMSSIPSSVNLSGYVTEADLASYTTTAALSNYATSTQLSSATTSNSAAISSVANEFSNYATTSQLGSVISTIPSSANLSGYVTTPMLSSYVTNSQIASYATHTDANNAYQNAVNTASNYTNSIASSLSTLISSLSSTATSLNNIINPPYPSWIPSGATQLPYGTNLNKLPSADTWYYILPNTLSNYTGYAGYPGIYGQHNFDQTLAYALIMPSKSFMYAGTIYNNVNQVDAFTSSGPYLEVFIGGQYWSNNF